MIQKADFTDWSYAERRGFLRMHSHGNENIGFYQMGEFMHPNGIVTVYCQEDFTRLDFMHGDRLHTRQWERRWGDRTIPKLARQFVSDIFQGIIV
jgi:hypothetical protein